MRNLLYSLPLAASLLFFPNTVSTAEAKDITVNFDVNLDSGSLVGQQFSGSFIYDDTGLFEFGFETAALTEFSFNFDGSQFSLADALNPFPEAEFFDGDLVGIFFASDFYSFEVDFFGEQFFAYVGDQVSGGDGFGDVVFKTTGDPPADVPENFSTFAFLPGLLVAGGVFLRKRVPE